MIGTDQIIAIVWCLSVYSVSVKLSVIGRLAFFPVLFLKLAVGSEQLAILYFFAYCPLPIAD